MATIAAEFFASHRIVISLRGVGFLSPAWLELRPPADSQAFVAYCVRTPRFPNLHLFREPDSYVVDPGVFRRAIGDVLWLIWLVGIVEVVEALHEYQIVKPLIRLP